jgi:hypothetical protein
VVCSRWLRERSVRAGERLAEEESLFVKADNGAVGSAGRAEGDCR